MLLEQIYANAYNENQNQNECDNNSRSNSPECEQCEEAECIELDPIETADDQSIKSNEL